jgi:dipeptidyl aminopeptidase/acylaminoacyl peptidase
MMNWIEGNWSDGFKCIVNHDGVFDTRGMAYSTEEQWFTEWENGGPTTTCRNCTRSFNPVAESEQVEDADAGGAGRPGLPHPDLARPVTFTALQRRGIESKLLVFPDENHWVLKPANSVLWHHTVIDWLDSYLKK